MIEIYLMIFCIFIIAFVIFAVIDRVLFGEWYTIYSVRYEHMRSVMRMWIGELREENEQLKFENKTLKSNYQREIQSSIDFCNAYSKTNGELLEEIER